MKLSNFNDKEFIEKYNIKPISHPHIIFPKLLDLLGKIEGKKILDLGCGFGNFSRMLAEKGAIVDCVDISEEMIKSCKEYSKNINNIKCQICDSSNLKIFNDNSFDAVVMNMVFLSIDSKEKVEKTFHEVSRILKKGGVFLFTDLHPLCIMIPKTLTEEQNLLDGFSYFKDNSVYKSKVILSDNSTSIEFIDSHWTLETYTKFINDSGMYIYRIIEPQPISSAPNIFKDYKLPEYILFYCKK